MKNVSADSLFSEEDIRLIVRHPDPTKRANATQRICRSLKAAPALTDADRRRAQKVLTHIAKDVAAMVRRALAVTLKNSAELPHDIAIALVKDIDNIAVPILECSPVLTDADLLDVLKSKTAAKIQAVARRPSISGGIVRAIIRFGDSQAVAHIAANDRAELDEEAYSDMLRLFASDDLIQESLISRRDLPPLVIERLMTQASEEVALRITARHDVPVDLAIDLAGRVRERATIDFVDHSWVARDLRLLMRRLHEEGRLEPSLILRAAACGRMRFAEYALAERAGISQPKAALMLHESGLFGLRALCKAAGITPVMQHIVHGAVVIFRDLELAGMDYDRAYFQRLMIERVLTLPVQFSDEDSAYLMEKLDYLSAEMSPF